MLTFWSDRNPLARFGARRNDAFDDLRREMNRLFFDFESARPGLEFEAGGGWPRVSLDDRGDNLVLRAEVPGVAEKDLELQVQENTVSLRGERKEAVPEGHSVHRKERGDFRFARSFQLPTAVAADKVEAHLKNGVLTVTLPKAETAKPRKISVRSS
jgi:HSP20 family protein